VLARQQAADLRLSQHPGQEFGGDVARQQAIAVLRERRMVPYRIVDAEADEPAEQQVESSRSISWRSERIE
jgi:hypothetical protein